MPTFTPQITGVGLFLTTSVEDLNPDLHQFHKILAESSFRQNSVSPNYEGLAAANDPTPTTRSSSGTLSPPPPHPPQPPRHMSPTRRRHVEVAEAGVRAGCRRKSTVYVSNLDYSLTNSDLHTLFSSFGKIARVTVLKDRASRRSRGVAFVLFVSRYDAAKAAQALDKKVLNGRPISASIAADNGRAAEFMRRRVYKDKSRCYECGEEGHLSYECPRNLLGKRERPVSKKREGQNQKENHRWRDDEEEEWAEDGDDWNWASVVDPRGIEDRRDEGESSGRKKKAKKKEEMKLSYFSDESGEDE